MSIIKAAVYVAAGVGTYEVLRRYGILQKAGEWLSEQVPDDYKDQARDYVEQARGRAQQYGGQLRERAGQYGEQLRDRAGQYGEQLRDRAGQYGERAQQFANQATETVRSYVGGGQPATAGGSAQDAGLSEQGGVNGPTSNSGNGHTGGAQNLSGPGRGTQATTDEGTGPHVPHTVGRGVVR